ncbi:type VI secretion system protein TssA [Type-D symbiont of Plautia stali]|uniref:type VI secretion system protein TssA n=1 Tax=Type-D symbiont of Plautia stali TaxID=1560356 RepID=UPI00073F749A|nr:type VI secretion system protein TssA [Type-D symbiont of Plautia stali]
MNGTETDSSNADIQQFMLHWENWLKPLSAQLPAGEDPAYDDDFQAMREEINKLTGMDTDRLCNLAESVLTTRAKDIRAVTWYTLARLARDGEKGLGEGLTLLCAMVDRFGPALHPLRPQARKAAVEWLNGDKFTDVLLRWPEVVSEDAALTTAALDQLEHLFSRFDEQEHPSLAGLRNALSQRLDRSGGAGALVPQNSSRAAESMAPASLQLAPVKSGRDLLDQAKLLSAWLSDQPAGWLAAHRLMKSVRWDTVGEIPPMDASNRTRLPPPKGDYRSQLKRLYVQQSWLELVDAATDIFCEGVNHFSLDVQWYLWQGLSRAGQPWEQYADYVVADLKLLLERLTGLETLAWNDGSPFADEVTLNWINEQVKGGISSFTELPVAISGTDQDDVLSLEAEAMAKGDSDGPEAALTWLQTRPGTHSPRSRWLLRLLMARVAEQFGRNDMALHLLAELSDSAPQLSLTEWEPALMFEVCSRRLKLLRVKSARSEPEKLRLAPEMERLMAIMIKMDPARALILCN